MRYYCESKEDVLRELGVTENGLSQKRSAGTAGEERQKPSGRGQG